LHAEFQGISHRPEALMLEAQSSGDFASGDAGAGEDNIGEADIGDGRPETPLQRLDRNLQELTGDRS
jgi:hypothetical protein